MKHSIIVLLTLISTSLYSQVNPSQIWGSWVVSKVCYKDGTELPDENITKYTYIKYTFEKPDKMYHSGVFNEKGSNYIFAINRNELIMQTDAAFIINTMKVERLNKDSLIILQKGPEGLQDPNSLQYHFIRESNLKESIGLTAKDSYVAAGGDTIYIESPKVYPEFIGDSFHNYLSAIVGKKNLMYKKSGLIKASFIVSKLGTADSLKIIQSISPKYDKLFTQTFMAVKDNWKPAVLNGKPVRVKKFIELRYLNSEETIPAIFITNRANQEFLAGNYTGALALYDQSLEKVGTDKENLYRRGMCKKNLNDLKGAVEDWKKIKELGGNTVDILLKKYVSKI